MRTLLLAALVAPLCGCADAQAPPADARPPVVVADGRLSDAPAPTDVGAWEGRPAFRQAVDAARAHWTAEDPGYEEEVRVLAVADGAFTEAGADQQAVLYVMGLWPRCCPKLGLAVAEGDRLVRNVAFTGSFQRLAAVPDLDGDGRDEVVLTGSFGMGGQVSTSATVLSVGAEGVTDWGTASIYDGACGALRDGEEAVRVLAGPGPAFTAERYARAACEDGSWEPTGGPEPLALDRAGQAYVDLPVR